MDAMQVECNFSTPVNYQGETPVSGEPFVFSEMFCNDNKFLQYENITSGANFYMQKSISIGDCLVIFFLVFFFCAITFKMLWNFAFKNPSSKL